MATTLAPSVVEGEITDQIGALGVTSTEGGDAVSSSSHAFALLLESGLRGRMSGKATIVLKGTEGFEELTTRWSEHNAPVPGAVVNVTCEADICAVVKFATEHQIPILAQTGGHGFSTSLLGLSGDASMVINLRAMNDVSFDLAAGTATLGAGVLTGEALLAAEKAKAHIMTGVCNTVGLVPALLGGGMGNQVSLYGLGVDNMVSARLVTAQGDVVVVNESDNEELWWGLRGAGVNFGIVSELTVKAYPEVNGGVHWIGTLGWPGSKEIAGRVMETIRNMGVAKGMGITGVWARVPGMGPTVLTNLWYAGSAEDAKRVYAPLFDLKPVLDMCSETPYSGTNAPSDIPCAKGGRKPVFSLGLKNDETHRLADAYEEWEQFSGHEDGDRERSVVLIECYGYDVVRQVSEGTTAYPWREVDVHVVNVPHTTIPSIDVEVNAYGSRFRSLLCAPDSKLEDRRVYVNFGNGDEALGVLYGGDERLEKLRGLKRRWDPEGVWGFYHRVK